jgi:undecaprenyl-diphosphatase
VQPRGVMTVMRRAASQGRTLPARLLALLAAAILASIGFGAVAAEMQRGSLDRLDRAVELGMHRLDSSAADAVMMAASAIGANFVLIPALVATIALAVYRRRRVLAIALGIDAFVVIAAYTALKILFARGRPHLFEKIAMPDDYSFPSGHAMSALGIYGAMAAVVIALHPAARRPVIAIAAVLIALIGLSRIYLGVHWPSDVLGGYLAAIPPLVVTVHLVYRERRVDRSIGRALNHNAP